MKTPITECIDYLKEISDGIHEPTIDVSLMIGILKSSLEKEKQVIVDAFIQGTPITMTLEASKKEAEEYYNQTFEH